MVISEIIRDHKNYIQQIFKLAKSDLLKTYRGAALGWAWAIIKPSVTIFVYWFAFTVGLRAGKDVAGYPYFLWLIAGLMPWFYMSEMLTSGIETIRKYNYLVTKMKFPISTIPTFVSISKFSVHLILMAITILIFIFMGYAPDIYIIQLPVYMLFSFIFFTIWSLFASLLSAISKDFSNLVKSFTTAIFWLSGILWNPATIQNDVLRKVLMINPVTYLTNGYRNCFINKVWFWEEPKTLLAFVIITFILLLLAAFTYKKLKKEIPDVL